MRNLVQTWYRLMRNFVQKSNLLHKRETVAQENLLFRGNPKLTPPITLIQPNSVKKVALV